jgi:hypothetical protein
MIDIDPRLDSKLRSKYDRIDAESVPPALANFDPAVASPRRRGLNLMTGIGAAAVVAAGLATFALEVSGHLHSPTSAPAANATNHNKLDVAPDFQSLSPFLPSDALPLLVGDTYAEGSKALPTFVPTKPYWIQFACLGTGSIHVLSSDGSVQYTSRGCGSPGLQGLFSPNGQVSGQPVSLRVETTSSTTWELRVAQSNGKTTPYETAAPSSRPGYPVNFTVPAGATPLIPDTHGKGSVTLPTFTPNTAFYNSVVSCSGPGSLEIIGSDGSTATQEACAIGAIGSGDGGESKPGLPISLVIKADPGTTWEIVVYGVNVELPQKP